MLASTGLMLYVAPNAVLTREGLRVQGQRSRLRHIEDLATVVFHTSAVVSTMLAELFPRLIGVPGEDGRVMPSDEEAWSHYHRHALMLKSSTSGTTRHQAGLVLLRWCLLAQAMVTLTGHPVGDTAAFLVVRLLVSEGGRALTSTPESWREYEDLERAQRSLAATIARLNGTGGDAPDPRAAAAQVALPWLEDLGVDLGGEARYVGHVCQLVTDLHLRAEVSVVELGRGHWMPLRSTAAWAFLEAFQTAAAGRDVDETVEVCASLTHDRGTTRFRAVRHAIPATVTTVADASYVFRCLRPAPARASLGLPAYRPEADRTGIGPN